MPATYKKKANNSKIYASNILKSINQLLETLNQ